MVRVQHKGVLIACFFVALVVDRGPGRRKICRFLRWTQVPLLSLTIRNGNGVYTLYLKDFSVKFWLLAESQTSWWSQKIQTPKRSTSGFRS